MNFVRVERMCLWFIDTHMLNWQTENPKNYNNKIELTVKKHAKNLFNSFWLRRYANIPKIFLCTCFNFVFLFCSVRLCGSSSFYFLCIFINMVSDWRDTEIYWNSHHSFDWFGILFEQKSLALFLFLSHTHTHTKNYCLDICIFEFLFIHECFPSLLFLLLFLMMLR